MDSHLICPDCPTDLGSAQQPHNGQSNSGGVSTCKIWWSLFLAFRIPQAHLIPISRRILFRGPSERAPCFPLHFLIIRHDLQYSRWPERSSHHRHHLDHDQARRSFSLLRDPFLPLFFFFIERYLFSFSASSGRAHARSLHFIYSSPRYPPLKAHFYSLSGSGASRSAS